MERSTMESFYNDYVQVLTTVGDTPTSESIDRLDEFYSPDLVVHVFMPPSHGGTATHKRDVFKGLLLEAHLGVKETLQTDQLVIDLDTHKIAAQQSLEFNDYETGEKIASMEAMAIYSLEQVQGSPRIVGLDLMLSDPGVLPSSSSG